MSWINRIFRIAGPPQPAPRPAVSLPTRRVNGETHAKSNDTLPYNPVGVSGAASSVQWQDNGTAAFALPEFDLEPEAAGRVSEYSAGDVVGDVYRIVRPLGRNKSFSVYLAEHLAWQQEVVLKTPRQEVLANRNALQTIALDASRWTALGMHPHIVYCHRFHLVAGVPFVVLEYVAGGSLRPRINNGSAAQLPVGLDLAIQLCHGIEHAHSHGLFHGAVMPENMLVTPEGVLRVTDFWTDSRSATATRTPTPHPGKRNDSLGEAYIAPELWVDAADLDMQTDIFAIGVCLYEILCGVRPYEIARGPRRAAPEPHGPDGQALPSDLAKLLQRCVDWDQEQRPVSVNEIRTELCSLYETLIGEPSPHANVPEHSCQADGWNNQALVALQEGRSADATSAWEHALSADPDHPEAAYNYGISRWRAGELTDEVLIRHLEDLATIPERRQSANHLLALVHLERGDVGAALSLLEELVAEVPKWAEVRAALEQARAIPRFLSSASRVLTPHRGYISGVSFTPDGKRLLSTAHDGTLCVIDTSSGRTVRSLEPVGNYPIGAMQMTRDGQFVITGSDDFALRLWEVKTGRCLKTVQTPGKVLSLAITDDATCALAVTCASDAAMGDTCLQMWDLDKERPLGNLKGHHNSVKSVALSGDGRRAVSGGDDHTVRIWDVTSHVCRLVLEGHKHYVSATTISDDGLLAISGSWDCTLRLWDTTTGRCLREFKGHDGIVTAVAFNSDKTRIISGAWDQQLRVWDVESGRCLRTFEGHNSMITAVAVDAGDRLVASASWDKTIRLWELPRVAPAEQAFRPSRRPASPSLPANREPLDRDERSVASSDAPAGSKLLEEAEAAVQAEAWEAALPLVQQLRELPESPPDPAIERLWQRLAKECAHTGVRGLSEIATIASPDTVCALQLASDARIAITGGRQDRLRLWDVDLERGVRMFRGHADRVLDICLSTDETMALSASADRTARLWDLDKGECLRILDGHQSIVSAAAMSRDQEWAISASYDHTVRIWDLNTAECVHVLAGHTRQVTAARFTADGHHVLSAGLDGMLRLWDRASGEALQVFGDSGEPILAAVVSPNERWVVSAAAHQPLRVWNMASGECARTLDGPVSALALSPDGRWLASAGADCCIYLWDLDTGVCAHSVDTASQGISSLAFSTDGRHLAAGTARPAILVWEIDWDLSAELRRQNSEGRRRLETQ